MDQNDWQMWQAGEPSYRKLPRTEEEAHMVRVMSIKNQKQRNKLELTAMGLTGECLDEKNYSHLHEG